MCCWKNRRVPRSSELTPLIAGRGRPATLFATWRPVSRLPLSRREPSAGRQIRSVVVEWKEDVESASGQGLDLGAGRAPGLRSRHQCALHSHPDSAAAFFLTEAELSYPGNRATPIAANLAFSDGTGVPILAEFDWRQTGPQTWDIRVETDAGRLTLSSGGSRLVHDDRTLVDENQAEYRGIYRRFVELITSRVSDVDLSPLLHVADAFMLGRRRDVEPFIEE
jgi:D-galactose 1-dehydrogenase